MEPYPLSLGQSYIQGVADQFFNWPKIFDLGNFMNYHNSFTRIGLIMIQSWDLLCYDLNYLRKYSYATIKNNSKIHVGTNTVKIIFFLYMCTMSMNNNHNVKNHFIWKSSSTIFYNSYFIINTRFMLIMKYIFLSSVYSHCLLHTKRVQITQFRFDVGNNYN